MTAALVHREHDQMVLALGIGHGLFLATTLSNLNEIFWGGKSGVVMRRPRLQ